MDYNGSQAVALKTASTGVCAKIIADNSVPKSMRDFVTAYKAALDAGRNTSFAEDQKMKQVINYWWSLGSKKRYTRT